MPTLGELLGIGSNTGAVAARSSTSSFPSFTFPTFSGDSSSMVESIFTYSFYIFITCFVIVIKLFSGLLPDEYSSKLLLVLS